MTTPQATAHQHSPHPQLIKFFSPFLLKTLFLFPFFLLGLFALDVRFEEKPKKCLLSFFKAGIRILLDFITYMTEALKQKYC